MNLSKLYEQENLFPNGFADSKKTDYGILFYNKQMPDSYDANHAIILNYSVDLQEAIEDIKSFYINLGLVPRIYQSFQSREERLFPVLERNKFSIETDTENILFIFDPAAKQIGDKLYPEIRRTTSLSAKFMPLILSEYESERMANVIKRRLSNPDFYLFTYYLDNEPVSIASLNIMDEFSRIDDVLTHKDFRNKGIATKIVNHIVACHSKISTNTLYLYASDPKPIKIYQKLGFCELESEYRFWRAVYESE